MNLRNIRRQKGQKGLHIPEGLAQENATSPTSMIGCPAQPYKNPCHRTFYHAIVPTHFSPARVFSGICVPS